MANTNWRCSAWLEEPSAFGTSAKSPLHHAAFCVMSLQSASFKLQRSLPALIPLALVTIFPGWEFGTLVRLHMVQDCVVHAWTHPRPSAQATQLSFPRPGCKTSPVPAARALFPGGLCALNSASLRPSQVVLCYTLPSADRGRSVRGGPPVSPGVGASTVQV